MTTDSKAGPRKRAPRLPLSYVVAIVPVAAALKAFGESTVSRGVELELGVVAVGEVEYARTL